MSSEDLVSETSVVFLIVASLIIGGLLRGL